MAVARLWRHTLVPATGSLVAMGIATYYLLLPLLHYAVASPGYRHITDSAKVFALSITWQLLTFVAAYTLAAATTSARLRIRERTERTG
jgi:hypothetical protein